MGDGFKMIRSDTVTYAAEMINNQTVTDRSVCEFVREAVREDRFHAVGLAREIERELAVAVGHPIAGELPASFTRRVEPLELLFARLRRHYMTITGLLAALLTQLRRGTHANVPNELGIAS